MREAMDSYLRALGIDKKMHEASVLAKWADFMGEAVAKRTERKYIKDRVLYIELNSSVMRNELMQSRSEIVKKVNAVAGVTIIDEVYLK
ncbi:MAG: DUF721 domain-containing protein [Crocinitomicaceae bacterium]